MGFKKQISDLAIFGGIPAFKNYLHVGRPNIGNRTNFLKRINKILDNQCLTNDGPFVHEFEEKIASTVGVKYCVAVCNATVGLEIASRAAGLSGEVIVPSFSFVATAHALWWQGITPIFCDVDPATHNIDPYQIEKLITPRTTGIVGVHLWGRPCNIDDLTRIARTHNLKLLFDAAHAFHCSYKGQMIGRFGDAEVFSFHATKFINSFEGGAIVTNNSDLASKARLMRNFGFAGYDNVISAGTNSKMHEASAAMGLTSLEHLDEFININQMNYKFYQEQLIDLPGVNLLTFDEKEKNNYQYVVLEIDEAYTKLTRDDLQRILWAENILARRYFYPGIHRMQPYYSIFPDINRFLPETEKLVQRVLCLPTGMSVGLDDIKIISHIIRFAVSHGEQIRQKLVNLSELQ